MKLLFSDTTNQDLVQATQSTIHAWLLEGHDGSGKATTARYLAARLLNVDEAKLASYPYFLEISEPAKAIGIEIIRTIQQFMSRKTTGTNTIRRIVIVHDCHLMTHEAQNAFLKLLEEPPADTVLILTIDAGHRLLPTVASRVRKLRLTSPSQQQVTEYFTAQGYVDADINTAYAITGGQIGLMASMLQQETTDLTDGITRAKAFLKDKPYERLCKLDSYCANREELHSFLQGLLRVAEAGLHSSAHKGQTAQGRHWHRIVEATHAAQALEATTPNIKLLMLNLSLEV